MYGVLLAAMMTSGTAAPDWGCHGRGCYVSCGHCSGWFAPSGANAFSYSGCGGCYGCYGGMPAYGCSACYGCYGGSVGCYAGSGCSISYSGCWGSYSACHGCSAYSGPGCGSGIVACSGMTTCSRGCSTGWSTCSGYHSQGIVIGSYSAGISTCSGCWASCSSYPCAGMVISSGSSGMGCAMAGSGSWVIGSGSPVIGNPVPVESLGAPATSAPDAGSKPKEDKPAGGGAGGKPMGGEGVKSSVPGHVARVTVKLPAEARLFVDDVACPLTSETRTFDTPPLEAGRRYYYTLRVELSRDGQVHRDSKPVVLEAGREAQVDFGTMVAVSTAQR